jgi:predicted nucleotidyltransferase
MVGISEEFKGMIPELFYAAQRIPKLAQLIIYGSVARGEEERGSDVDLLLVFETEEDPEKTDIAKLARQEIEKAFVRAESERRVQVAMTNLRAIDESFLENIAREGVVIWGKPFFLGAEGVLRPMILFEYRVGGKSKVEKVRFYRALKSLEAIKVKNGILVSQERAKDAENIFKINKIEHKRSKVWLS